MKTFLLLLFSFCLSIAAAQNNDALWKRWNTNYPQTDIIGILKVDKEYALTVERDTAISHLYIRNDKYRFMAKYLGSVRPIDPAVLSSIKRVGKETLQNPTILDHLFEQEIHVAVDNMQLWMPIQKQVMAYFKKEVKTGDNVMLYCTYTNEHTIDNRLFTTFAVAEFAK